MNTYIYENSDFTLTDYNVNFKDFDCAITFVNSMLNTVTNEYFMSSYVVVSNEIDASNLSDVVDLAQMFAVDENNVRINQHIDVSLNL